jgi:5-methyltetrahydrofolate--homocysteine methyltransferase
MTKASFLSKITNHDILIADGATGTNLIARGLLAGETAESWVLAQPDMIIQLHKEFINAGADIILTSTFSASSIRLKNSPLADKTEAINRNAVELARQAADTKAVYIAGSLGPVGQLLKPYGPLELEQVISAYADQANAITQAGADLLVIETQFDLGEIKAAIQGVHQVSDLPLVVSISYDRGRRTMMGVNPTQAAKELDGLPFDLIGINCGHSLEENLQNLVELKQVTAKPIWFKPNAGLPHLDANGNTSYDITPDTMGALSPSWLAAGAQVVGGCCGTSPAHLAAISKYTRTQL